MALERYWKRVMDFPGIVRHPERAKLDALLEAGGRVILEEETDVQRVLFVETPKGESMLLLDGEIQFYSGDEHRYHECLALVPVLFAGAPVRRIGIMGGGDGLIARELLRHFGDEVESIHVVDLDPVVTDLARTDPRLLDLNERSLQDERVHVVNEDARVYRASEPLDLVICDLPDPANEALARLYTRDFYAHLRDGMTVEGLLASQILVVPPVFDGVLATMRSVFPSVREYATSMYSFVRVGFGLAGPGPLERRRQLPEGTRFLTEEVVEWLFYFPPDEPRSPTEEIATEENGKVADWYATYLAEYVEERVLYY